MMTQLKLSLKTLAVFLFVAFALFPAARTSWAFTINTAAKQAIVVDFETGTVLFEKNADEKMPTSSMSKVLTTYAVFDALDAGSIALDDTFIVSEKAWRKGGSKMFVEVNKKVKIEDLLQGVIVQSGNDATIVLAEGLAGTEDNFAMNLNIIAQKLGMKNSHFVNASGWPDPDHYSTARDLSILAQALIKNHAEYYPYFSEKEFTYQNITQQNRNPLLYQEIGADGVKTGHTEAGGYGLIGSGIAEDGRRIVIVINGLDGNSERAQESKKLLQWGMNAFENRTIIQRGTVIGTADVFLGKQDTVSLKVQEDIRRSLPKIVEQEKQVTLTTVYEGPLQAPIREGDEVGELTVSVPGQARISYPLFAAEDVEEAGFFARVIFNIKSRFLG